MKAFIPKLLSALCLAGATSFLPLSSEAAPPVPGAIFTTDVTCTGVNINIYDDKADVYVNGGPDHPGAAGLIPNTQYYVQVTTPSGDLVLGSSTNNAGEQRPVLTNALGNFSACYQLQAIVSLADQTPGYANTTNPGGEYKVWISTVATFDNPSTKTDNFKVKPSTPPPPDEGQIAIRKFYDANANSQRDAGEPELPTAGLAPYGSTGWKVDLLGFPPQNTPALYQQLALTDYTAEEFRPIQQNWVPTAPLPVSSDPTYLNQTLVSLSSANKEATVWFGNVCLGPGGGYTLGFWSNKNGQARMTSYGMASALGFLSGLNLRNYDGTPFDPASYAAFRTWLLNGNAVNMAYMLSVQLAAMELNVLTGSVSGAALVYAPGSQYANAAGFVDVATLMAEANTSLANDNLTWAGIPARAYQAYLKSALDAGNNNQTFVQANPCAYTFTDPVLAP